MKTSTRQITNPSAYLQALLAFGALLLLSASAHAAADSWTGATNSNFSGSNWGGTGFNNPPHTGDSLVFLSGTGAGGTTLTDDYFTSGSSVAGITFSAGAVSFTINPGVAGTNGFTLTGGITNSSTSLQTINDLIVVSGTQTITTTAAGGNIILGGTISGAGAGLTTAGSGTLFLSATNSFSGTFKQAGGITAINANETLSGTSVSGGAIGTGTLVLSSGSLISTTGTQSIDNVTLLTGNTSVGGANALTFNSSGGSFTNSGNSNTLTNNNTGGLTLAGPIFLSETAGTARTLVLSGTNVTTITGSIASVAATGTLNYSAGAASGELILSNSNSTYSTMFLQGSGTLAINTNQVLSGTSVLNGPIGTGTFKFSGGVLAALGTARSIDNVTTFLNSSTISGTNAITFNSSGGSFTNSGANSSFTNNDTAGVTLAGPVFLSESSATARIFIIVGTGTTTISGSVANSSSGAGGTGSSLESNLTAGGELILSSSNSTFSGSMILQNSGSTAINAPETVTGGVLTNGPLGTGTLALNGGNALIATGGARSVDNAVALIASSSIGGTNAITFNSSAGSFTNSAGNFTLTASDTGGVTLSGTINLSETAATGRNFTVGGTSTVTISGPVLGAAAGTSTTTGTLSLANTGTGNIESGSIGQAVLVSENTAGTNWIFQSTNSTYSGSTVLQTGTLGIGAADTVVSGAVTKGPIGTGTLGLKGGTLLAAGGAQAIDNPTVIIAAATIGGTNNLTFNSSGGSFTDSGAQTLTVTNTGTTIFAGPLYLSETTATSRTFTIAGSGNVIISGTVLGAAGGTSTTTGTLALSGTATGNIVSGSIGGAVGVSITGSSNSTFQSTNSTFTGPLIVNAAGAVLQFGGSETLTSGTVSQGSIGTGTLTLSSSMTLQASGASRTVSNNILYNNVNYTIGGTNNLTLNGTQFWFGSNTIGINNTGITTFGGTFSLRNDTSNQQRSLALTGAGNTVFNGPIVNGSSLNGFLIFNGSGTTSLNGNNTYNGATTIGVATGTATTTVKLGNANGLGFGGVNTNIAGTVTVNAASTLDLNGQTGVNKPIALTGTTAVTSASLVNTNSGTAASIGNGITTLALTAGGSGYSAAPSVTINGSGTGATAVASLGVTAASFTINPNTTVYSGAPTVTITGGGGQTATATAILTSGTVSGITITSGGFGFTSAPTITFSGGTITTPGTNPTGTGNATNFTITGLQMTAAGAGYTGTPTVTFGSGAATATATISSVSLTASGAGNTNPNYTVGGAGDITVAAVISGGGGATLTKSGTDTVFLTGVNTYTATTAINAGTLQLGDGTTGHDGTIANGSNIVLGGGNLIYNRFAANTYTGTISGNGTVVMIGSGTQTLGGTNSYTGTTTIRQGNLSITGSFTGAGVVNVSPNQSAIATLSGNGFLSGTVSTANASGSNVAHLAPGVNTSGAANNFGVSGTLHMGAGLTIGNGTNLDFDLGTSQDQIVVTGQLTLGTGITLNINQLGGFAPGTYTLITYSGGLTGDASTWTATGQPGGDTVTFAAGSGVVTVNISAGTTSTTYTLAATPGASRVMQGGTTGVNSVITNTGTGTADNLAYTNLNSTATTGSVGGSPTSGTIAPLTSATNTTTYTANGATGLDTITPTATGTNATLGTAATLQSTTTGTVAVLANRSVTASTVNLGDVLVGGTASGTTTLSTASGDDNHATRITVLSSGSTNGTATVGSGTGAVLFNGNGVSTTRGVTASFGTSGTAGGSVSLSVTGEGLAGESDTAPAVGYTANVFQAFTGTDTVASGTTLNLTNSASTDGGQRAGISITGFSSTNSNFIVTPSGGAAVGTANGSDVTATVGTVTVANNLLSGTYTYNGTVTGTAQYTDAPLQTTAVSNQTWSGVSVTGTVSASVGYNTQRQAFVASGSSLAGYGLTSNTGFQSTAVFLNGTTSTDSTVTMKFTANGGHPANPFQSSDTLTLGGLHQTGSFGVDGSVLTDAYVLQLSSTAQGYIAWWDANTFQINGNGNWVNAIAGNSTANLPTDYGDNNAFLGTYAQYLTAHSFTTSTPLSSELGAYGYYFDGTTWQAWAVLDHNSDFEVIPEPSTYAMIFSGFGMLIGFRRLRRRK